MRVTFIHRGEFSPEQFDQAKPLLQPVIDQAARGEFTVEDLEQMTREGGVITGIAYSGERAVMAMCFEFVHYPRAVAVNVMALGGECLEEVASSFWRTFMEWARTAGATMVEASCSRAMARLLQARGFQETYRVVRVRL